MKAQWRALASRFAALAQREKILVTAAVVVGIVFLGFTLWVEPAAQRLKILNKQIGQQTADQASLQAQLAGLRAQMKDPDAPTRAGLADVRARIAAADGEIAQFGGVLVAPDRVAELLQSLLSRHGGLSLVSLRTLPPSPLIAPPTPDKDAKPAEKSAERPAVAMPAPGNIYRHGIEIKVSGTYHGLLGYVAELERSPQKLLWGSMALKVTSHPYSELTLVVYTLSLDPTWLIV